MDRGVWNDKDGDVTPYNLNQTKGSLGNNYEGEDGMGGGKFI